MSFPLKYTKILKTNWTKYNEGCKKTAISMGCLLGEKMCTKLSEAVRELKSYIL